MTMNSAGAGCGQADLGDDMPLFSHLGRVGLGVALDIERLAVVRPLERALQESVEIGGQLTR